MYELCINMHKSVIGDIINFLSKMMRLELFEKSEKLGPTILSKTRKIVDSSGIFEFCEKFHFSKNFREFRNLKSYTSYILIYHITLFIYT